MSPKSSRTLRTSLPWLKDWSVHIEQVGVRRVEGVNRSGKITDGTVIALSGRHSEVGPLEEGLGEVPHRSGESMSNVAAALDSLGVAGTWSLGAYLERVRRSSSVGGGLGFALEIAGLDLALKQFGQGLEFPVVDSARAVRFVVSILACASPESVLSEYLSADASLEFRVVPSGSWTEASWSSLLGFSQLRILSLSGFERSAGFESQAFAGMTEFLRQRPDVIVENPTDEALDALGRYRPVVCWNLELGSVGEIDRRARSGDYVCVRPSDLRNLDILIETVESCEEAGLGIYGGDEGEVGPWCEQHQALASALYPGGPNDLAPLQYYSLPHPTGHHNPLAPPYETKPGLRFRALADVDPWYRGTEVGAKLKARREDLGLEVAEVASAIGWEPRAYDDIEGGGDYFVCCVSVGTAKAVCEVLNLDLLALCGLSCSGCSGEELCDEWRGLPRNELVSLRRQELGLTSGDVRRLAGWEEGEERVVDGAETDANFLDQALSLHIVVELAEALQLSPDILLGVGCQNCGPR